jgi:hypothetical protein
LKQNCWEFKNCGRTPGGTRAHEHGVCPVAVCSALDGVRGGKNAGRTCWVVARSLCGGEMLRKEGQKRITCWQCDFLQTVMKEEK